MFEYLFDNVLNMIVDPEEQEKFTNWVEEVAQKIAEIIHEMDDSEEFATELLDKMDQSFVRFDTTLLEIYQKDKDIESAAYKILNIIKKDETS